jgi:hypothetical protein
MGVDFESGGVGAAVLCAGVRMGCELGNTCAGLCCVGVCGGDSRDVLSKRHLLGAVQLKYQGWILQLVTFAPRVNSCLRIHHLGRQNHLEKCEDALLVRHETLVQVATLRHGDALQISSLAFNLLACPSSSIDGTRLEVSV